jgi:hypothetical protein
LRLTIGVSRTYPETEPQAIADDLHNAIRAMEAKHESN